MVFSKIDKIFKKFQKLIKILKNSLQIDKIFKKASKINKNLKKRSKIDKFFTKCHCILAKIINENAFQSLKILRKTSLNRIKNLSSKII